MGITARAMSAIARHRRLSTVAALLSATVLTIGLSAIPASADSSFTPTPVAVVDLYNDSGSGYCLSGPYEGITNVGMEPDYVCSGAPNDPPFEWYIATTPFNGYNFVNGGTTGTQCLDSDFQGYVYIDGCNWNDEYQSWTITGGSISGTWVLQDQATGLCLTSDDIFAGDLYTTSCSGAASQDWLPGVVEYLL